MRGLSHCCSSASSLPACPVRAEVKQPWCYLDTWLAIRGNVGPYLQSDRPCGPFVIKTDCCQAVVSFWLVRLAPPPPLPFSTLFLRLSLCHHSEDIILSKILSPHAASEYSLIPTSSRSGKINPFSLFLLLHHPPCYNAPPVYRAAQWVGLDNRSPIKDNLCLRPNLFSSEQLLWPTPPCNPCKRRQGPKMNTKKLVLPQRRCSPSHGLVTSTCNVSLGQASSTQGAALKGHTRSQDWEERRGQYRQQGVLPLWKMPLLPKYQKLHFYQITLLTQERYDFLPNGYKSHKGPSGAKTRGTLSLEIQQGHNYTRPHSRFTALLPASWCQADPCHPPGLCQSHPKGTASPWLPHRRLPWRLAWQSGQAAAPDESGSRGSPRSRLTRFSYASRGGDRLARRGWRPRWPTLGYTPPLPLQPPAVR